MAINAARTSWLLFQELREAEAVLAIIRTELRMDAYAVPLTGLSTARRRYQTKERELYH